MKIFVTGTRGIPDIPGGVEKHCQELYPRIVSSGHEVILGTCTPYIRDKQAAWQGVQLRHIFAPHKKSLEAIVHTFLAAPEAGQQLSDGYNRNVNMTNPAQSCNDIWISTHGSRVTIGINEGFIHRRDPHRSGFLRRSYPGSLQTSLLTIGRKVRLNHHTPW